MLVQHTAVPNYLPMSWVVAVACLVVSASSAAAAVASVVAVAASAFVAAAVAADTRKASVEHPLAPAYTFA